MRWTFVVLVVSVFGIGALTLMYFWSHKLKMKILGKEEKK